jgi:hypothetical protein
LATGRVVDGIANSPVRAFAVELRDGAIYVGPSLEPSLEPVEGGIR